MNVKKLFIFGLVAWSIISPLAIIGGGVVMEAAAEDAVCRSGPIIAVERRRHCGFFQNERNTGGRGFGDAVRAGGVPGGVNSVESFVQLVKDDINSGNAHRVTAAQFVILTMIQHPAGLPKNVTAAQLAEWETRVRSYATAGENGSTSFGADGRRVDWYVSQHMDCNSPQNINTFYQIQENDVAPFLNHAGNSECEKSGIMELFIVFRNPSGAATYTIRRECMNPMGNILGIDEAPQLNYDLRPIITPTVNDNPVSGAAEVGDTIKFTYQVTNDGDDNSPSANCAIYGNAHAGYFATPATPTESSSGGYSPPPTGCPRVFNAHSSTPLNTETFVVSGGNQTMCRSLFVSPSTSTVGSLGTEVCIPVGTKPYVRVFGGDVSAGNNLIDSAGICAPNNDAAIVGWNKRASGGFVGAATQYAAFALGPIIDFAGSLGNGGSSATTPAGLSFGNTDINPPNGEFGGDFGSMPCIPDYFVAKPGGAAALPANVSAITSSGVYEATGTTTLGGGQIDTGERITAYVEGDLYITGNITYAGGFNRANAPLFRVIVLGNIFIDNDVTQLDGVYIAQKTFSGGGAIHTCATSAAALGLDGSLLATCSKKLTVNGAFIADQVLLLRTANSLSQSHGGETSASNNAAEVFNYGPALWLAQPNDGTDAEYEAIISLPPIL